MKEVTIFNSIGYGVNDCSKPIADNLMVSKIEWFNDHLTLTRVPKRY